MLRVVDGLSGAVLCEVPAELTWGYQEVFSAIEEATEIPGCEIRLLWAGKALGAGDVTELLAGDARTVRLVRIEPEWNEALDVVGERILADASLEKIQEAVASGGDGGDAAYEAVKAGGHQEQQSEVLLRDKRFLMAALLQEGSALRFAPEELRADREVALLAVQESGVSLRFAADELRGDRDLVMVAVRSNGSSLEFASKALQGDREVVETAVQENGEALRFAPEMLRRDRALALTAVRRSGAALRHAHFVLQHDRGFVLEAVRANGEALTYVVEELRRDKEVALAAKAYWEGNGDEPLSPQSWLKRAHYWIK